MGDEAPMNMPVEPTVHTHVAPARHTSETPSVNTATGSDHPDVIEEEELPRISRDVKNPFSRQQTSMDLDDYFVSFGFPRYQDDF
jgi:hypothetical protein